MIYTALRDRALAADIETICTEIALQTYFRRAGEMQATDERWKLQAGEMLARVIRDKAHDLGTKAGTEVTAGNVAPVL